MKGTGLDMKGEGWIIFTGLKDSGLKMEKAPPAFVLMHLRTVLV